MEINDTIFDLPGNVSQSIFRLEPQQQVDLSSSRSPGLRGSLRKSALDDEQNKQKDPAAGEAQTAAENVPVEVLVYQRMSQLRVNPLPASTWNRKIPQWDSRDDRDKDKRAAFEKELSALKEKVGTHYVSQNKKFIKQQSEALKKRRADEGLSPRYHEQKAEIMRSLEPKPQTAQSMMLQVDPNDVYMEKLSILPFLAMFRKPFDYSEPISEYLKKFGNLSAAQARIAHLAKKTHAQKLVFNIPTPDGQLRAKQLQRADMYNKQLQQSYSMLVQICCGAFYLPDKNFTRKYEELPQEIKDLLTIKMMSNKVKTPLYALIGCGEAVNYLTFEMNVYDGYVKSIEKQFKEEKTWEPFKFYEKALQYVQINKRTKGVATQYQRCGYEMQLMFRVECVLLYFIAQLTLKFQKAPELNGSEFVVFQEKLKDSLQHFEAFEKRADDLWTAVKEFVTKRTGGVKAVKVVLDEEGNPIDDPNQPTKKRVYDRFQFQDFGISYSQARVFKVSEEPPEPELYEEVQKAKKITFDNSNRVVNNACAGPTPAPAPAPAPQPVEEKKEPPQPPAEPREKQPDSPPAPQVEVPPPDDMWKDDEPKQSPPPPAVENLMPPPPDAPAEAPAEVPPPDDMWKGDAPSKPGDSQLQESDLSMTSEGKRKKKKKHSAEAEAALQSVMSLVQSSMDTSTLPDGGDDAPRKRKKRSKRGAEDPESTTQDTQE